MLNPDPMGKGWVNSMLCSLMGLTAAGICGATPLRVHFGPPTIESAAGTSRCSAAMGAVDVARAQRWEQFRSGIVQLRPQLVSTLLAAFDSIDPRQQHLNGRFRDAQALLQQPCCGFATEILQPLLERAGYRTRRWLIQDLNVYLGAVSHLVLTVDFEGSTVIVDPTFQQFIPSVVYSPHYAPGAVWAEMFMPQEQILVLPQSALSQWLMEWVRIRREVLDIWRKHFGINQLPAGLPNLLRLSDAEFADFMHAPWDLSSPDAMPID